MNAYKIMLFILLFSFCVSIVNGLQIYSTTSVYANDTYGVNITNNEIQNYNSWDAIWSIIGSALVISIASGIISGSLANWITGVPGDKAFLYSTFMTFYVVKCAEAIQIFWNIGHVASQRGSTIGNPIYLGVILFSLVCVLALLSFLMQLIGGPWYSME